MTDAGRPTMDKDRIDNLFRLAEFSWRDFDTRRSYEWKVSFGLWTALGVLAGTSLRVDIHLPSKWFTCIAGLILIIVCIVYTCCWTRGLYERQTRNQESAHAYLDIVEAQLKISSPRFIYQPPPPKSRFRSWTIGSQIAFTWLLATLAFFCILEGVQACGKRGRDEECQMTGPRANTPSCLPVSP
jgi:hypothetical protein